MRANSSLRPLTLRMPAELQKDIRAAAKREGVSVNAKINELLRDSFINDELDRKDAEIVELRDALDLRNQTACDRKEIIQKLEAEILECRANHPPSTV